MSNFSEALIATTLGGVLALIGGFLQSMVAAKSQRTVLVLDRKLQTLREFASISYRGPTEFVPELLRLRDSISSTVPDSQLVSTAVRYAAIQQPLMNWMQEHGAERALASALFGEHAPELGEMRFTNFPKFGEGAITIDPGSQEQIRLKLHGEVSAILELLTVLSNQARDFVKKEASSLSS